MTIENARKADAKDLARLINMAGEGIPQYLWKNVVSGDQTPLEIGAQRAAREGGGFSYTNARVIRSDSSVIGMIIAYPLLEAEDEENISEYPEVVRPLVRLENEVIGSWYVNAIATSEASRGMGVATKLLYEAEQLARQNNIHRMSLIVASENDNARQLYQRLGYKIIKIAPVTQFPGALHGGDWELMVKPLLPDEAC